MPPALVENLLDADVFFGKGSGGHFAGMPMVADRRGVGVKNRKNLPMS